MEGTLVLVVAVVLCLQVEGQRNMAGFGGGFVKSPFGEGKGSNAPSKGGANGICKLPKATGPCRAAHRKWYFDSGSQKCTQFTYGGCRGNENNFNSAAECKAACHTGGMKNTPDKAIVAGPSAPSKENKAVSGICKLPKATGPCRAAHRKWYFDSGSQKCTQFTYGGCRGNENNFNSAAECKAACHTSGMVLIPDEAVEEKPKDKKVASEVCKLPMKSGPCMAMNRKWYFDSGSQKCTQFTYGGCRGNENNFNTEAECQAACPTESTPEQLDEPQTLPEITYEDKDAKDNMDDKFESVKKLANLASEQGIIPSDTAQSMTKKYHPAYSQNMQVCLCY